MRDYETLGAKPPEKPCATCVHRKITITAGNDDVKSWACENPAFRVWSLVTGEAVPTGCFEQRSVPASVRTLKCGREGLGWERRTP